MVRNGVCVYFLYSGQHACGSLFHLLMFSRKLCIGKKNSPPVVNFYSLLQRLKPEGNPKVNRNHACVFHDLNWDCLSQRKCNTYMCNLIRPPSGLQSQMLLQPCSQVYPIFHSLVCIDNNTLKWKNSKMGKAWENSLCEQTQEGQPS